MAKAIIVPRGTSLDGPYRSSIVDGACVRVPRLAMTPFTVAGQPAGAAGGLGYSSNGDTGDPCGCAHDGSVWRRLALGGEVALCATETWTDEFLTEIGALWTQRAAPGTSYIAWDATESAEQWIDGTISYWNTGNKDFSRISVDLADVGTETECLFRIESLFIFGSGAWTEYGVAFRVDDSNAVACVIGNQGSASQNTGRVFMMVGGTRTDGALSSADVEVGYVTRYMRLYWNAHPSKTYTLNITGSPTLAPGYFKGFISSDGSTWTEYSVPATGWPPAITPTNATLWTANGQPGFQTLVNFDYAKVDRSTCDGVL